MRSTHTARWKACVNMCSWKLRFRASVHFTSDLPLLCSNVMFLSVERDVIIVAQVQPLVCAQHDRWTQHSQRWLIRTLPGRRTATKLRHIVLTRTQFPVAKFRTTRLFSSNDRRLGEWVRDAEKGTQWTIRTPGEGQNPSWMMLLNTLGLTRRGSQLKNTSAVRTRESAMTNTSIITTFSECKAYVPNIALEGWILSVAPATVYR